MTTLTLPTIDEFHQFAVLLARFLDTRIRVGLCTCCAEPRPMFVIGGDNEEWQHADDETFAEVRHVHEDSASRDCDGLYDRSHVYRIPSIRPEALRPSAFRAEGERVEPDFHDLWCYLARHAAPMYRECEIRCHDGRVEWHAPTDEGYEGGELRVCSDPWCAYDEATFRDHTAEAAGY